MSPYDVTTFEEFWPHYQELHSRRITQRIHAVATLSFIGLVTTAVLTRNPLFALAAPIADYLVAQTSHRLFEHNRTTPWKNPLWHARAELRLLRNTVRTLLS